jgi:hypothetical protein
MGDLKGWLLHSDDSGDVRVGVFRAVEQHNADFIAIW